jgi:hypothetical protein
VSGWDSLSWEAKRGAVLSQALFLCEICDDEPATDVDHIWPRSLGGSDQRKNLRAACGPCNKSKGNRIYGDDINRDPTLAVMGVVHHRREALSHIIAACKWSAVAQLVGLHGMDTSEAEDALLALNLTDIPMETLWALVDHERERLVALVAPAAPEPTVVEVNDGDTEKCIYGCGASVMPSYATGPKGHYTTHAENGDVRMVPDGAS